MSGWRRTTFCCCALLGCSWAHLAMAADLPKANTGDDGGTAWIVTVGVMTQYGPDFTGAKTNGISFVPQFSFRREGESAEFSAPDDGVDYAIYDTPALKIGPVATFDPGRSRKADISLAGLDNFSWRVEAGAYVEFWPIQDFIRTRIEMLRGLHSNDGFSANLGADMVRRYGDFTLSAGPRLVIADSDAMQFQFGVSPQAALRHGHVAAFEAGGGVQSMGVNATLNYDISEDWRLTIFDRYDRLVGDAADSPITRQFGSADQFTVGIGATYSFAVGD
jgi:outer membrane protein